MKTIPSRFRSSPSVGRGLSALALLVSAGLVACGDDFDSGSTQGCEPGSIRACYSGPDGTEGTGACIAGSETCRADGTGYGPCEGEVVPHAETCATPADDDCDGEVNEEGAQCSCMPGDVMPCYSGMQATKDVGHCKSGTVTCAKDGSVPPGCDGEVLPGNESCWNGDDEDCDGSACAKPLWSKLFGGAEVQAISAVAVGQDGKVAVAGWFRGTMDLGAGPLASAGMEDAFVALFDADGLLLWSKRAGDASTQKANGVAIDPSGNVLVVGTFKGTMNMGGTNLTSHNVSDGFIAKLDSTGAHVWSRAYGSTESVEFAGVASDTEGNVAIVGNFSGTIACASQFGCPSSAGGTDLLIYEFGPAGLPIFGRYLGNAQNQYGKAIAVAPGGNVLIGGSYSGTLDFENGQAPLIGLGGSDAFVAELDHAGKPMWANGFPAADDQSVTAVAADAQGNVVVGGYFGGTVNLGGGPITAGTSTGGFVAKYSSNGTYVWAHAFTAAMSSSTVGSVAMDAQGNTLVAGIFEGTIDLGAGALLSGGLYDAYVGKFDATGKHITSASFGDGAWQGATSVAASPTGEIVVAGINAGSIDLGGGPLVSSSGSNDAFLAKFAP